MDEVDPEKIAASIRAAHEAQRQVEEEERAAGRDPVREFIGQIMPMAEHFQALSQPSRWTVLVEEAAEWLKALALAAIAAALWWRL